MPTTVKTLGDRIMVKRLEKKLLQREIATKLGIPVSLVIAWENDTQTPNSEQWKAISDLLGLSEFDAKYGNPTRE